MASTFCRRLQLFIAAVTAMAILAIVGLMPVSAAGQTPFQARSSGSFTFNASGTGLNLVGAANAIYLGKSADSGTITFLGPATCAGGFAIHDVETLTSIDDGERISFSVDGQACPTTGPSQPFGTGVYEVVASYTVTGGTGRFAGASGQGTADCFGNFDTHTFNFTMNGTISRPSGG